MCVRTGFHAYAFLYYRRCPMPPEERTKRSTVEQLICNQQVGGSSPSTSSRILYGGIPEWPKGTDCKSAGYAYGGSNPPAPTKTALISSKSGLFCNFSGHFAFQRMEGRNGENQRQSKLARMRFSDSAPNPQVSENGFDPQLTHTGII